RAAATRLTAGRALPHEIVDGRTAGQPFLDDYAFLIAGLLDLFEADPDPRWLRQAIALQAALAADLADAAGGGHFFTAARQELLPRRPKPDDAGALPAGNSVAALNLLRLAEYTDDTRYRDGAEAVFRAFATVVTRAPAALPYLLAALDFALDHPKEIVIA